ncbi:MAG: hypothetical protein J6A88_08050 [Oscillospiraceae bacterium]|nr:hypothetical protein [Oscillospiraceae bacterium]
MKSPKLKNALLCRILVYVVVLGGFIAPIIIVANLKFVPEAIKVIVGMGLAVGLLVYLIKNFVLLMAMDVGLAMLHCHNTARKHFVLPKSFSEQKVEREFTRFGKEYEPSAISPRPETLRYKSNAPMTIYSSGIEKIIATYHIDFLDKNQYHLIINSATANSKALKGKKKHWFLDKSQKSSPLNRATVIVIYAKQVDEKLRNSLFDVVCKNGGDGFDTAILPCVMDLEKQICTFDSMRMPYTGFQYPVKNRGIKIIRKYLFNNKFPFADSPDMLDPIKDMDPEQSLWDFWKTMKKELVSDDKNMKKRFEKMKHRDIIFEDGYIYLKWEDHGLWISVELNEERRMAAIDPIDSWDYPKSYKIAKATIKEIEILINTYFAGLGYTTKYISYE